MSGPLLFPDAPAGWCGWLRDGDGGPWRCVCRAPTEREAMDLLLADRSFRHAQKQVLREGERPRSVRLPGQKKA